jgi:CRP-like cAMP-binding protein
LRAAREARIVADGVVRRIDTPTTNVTSDSKPRTPHGRRIGHTWRSYDLVDIPLFAGLGRRHLNKVAALGRIRRFQKGVTIVAAGESGDALYVVLEGEVSVQRRRLPAITRGIGSVFGEMALLDGGPRSATVVARGSVACLTISRSGFQKLLRKEPAMSAVLLKELATRLRAAEAGTQK